MSSILTNNSAMVALQSLQSVNSNLAKTQDMISTGKAVGSAKDNAATFAISKVMESDVGGFKAISESLSLGEATVSVARQASETVTDLLTEIKGKIVGAQEENVDRAKIQTDIDQLTNQIQSVVDAAQFNGLNMLKDDSVSTDILSSLDRDATGVTASNITVNQVDLRVFAADGSDLDATGTDGGIVGRNADDTADVALSAINVGGTGADETTRANALSAIEGMIQQAVDASANFGSSEKRLEIQSEFVGKLTDAFKSGIGTLVDANMEEASARLQALQVQQQLSTQSLSIANQAPQALLSLFRG